MRLNEWPIWIYVDVIAHPHFHFISTEIRSYHQSLYIINFSYKAYYLKVPNKKKNTLGNFSLTRTLQLQVLPLSLLSIKLQVVKYILTLCAFNCTFNGCFNSYLHYQCGKGNANEIFIHVIDDVILRLLASLTPQVTEILNLKKYLNFFEK